MVALWRPERLHRARLARNRPGVGEAVPMAAVRSFAVAGGFDVRSARAS